MVAAPTMNAGCVSKATGTVTSAVANWRAEPYHCGGTQGNLNGGIIASLIDCHSLNLAIAHAYRVARAADRQRAAHRLRDGEFASDSMRNRRRSISPSSYARASPSWNSEKPGSIVRSAPPGKCERPAKCSGCGWSGNKRLAFKTFKQFKSFKWSEKVPKTF